MNGNIYNYFIELGELFSKIEVGDKNGKTYGFSLGLDRMVKLLTEQTIKKTFKVIFIGNGANASIASHQALDYWKSGGMRAMSFNDSSLLTCMGNDFGYEHVFEKPMRMFAEKGDVVIALSSSGKSKNILTAAKAAKEKGCKIITMSGFNKSNPLRRQGDINFYVPSHSYGQVEIIHLAVCHCVVDFINEQKFK